jgi:two-component system repressor protein LuxO
METSERVLIVEDSEPMAMAYADFLQPRYQVLAVHTLEAAREVLNAEQPLALLLDLQLPDGDGLDLIPEIREAGGAFPIIVITSDSSIDTAVTALQSGADDFLEKPFSADRLRTTVTNGVEKRRLKSLVHSYETEAGRQSFEGFIGGSLVMQGIYHMVESAASSKATVFITGESGTGKEVLARAVHARSPRKKGAFVALNCGAIPSELMESEIFGHLKGSFTGAAKDCRPVVALYSLMKFVRWRWNCRLSCCGFCRQSASAPWAVILKPRLMSELSAPPTRTLWQRSRRETFARIYSIGYTSLAFICRL